MQIAAAVSVAICLSKIGNVSIRLVRVTRPGPANDQTYHWLLGQPDRHAVIVRHDAYLLQAAQACALLPGT